MAKLKKLLAKFSAKEREILVVLIGKIISLNWRGLDIKKLKGQQNIFRVRKGKMRIIFLKNQNDILILAIERRSEKTYKF